MKFAAVKALLLCYLFAPAEAVASQELSVLLSGSVPLIALTFLGLGLLLSLTPCVLPMIPILSGFIVGANTTQARGILLSVTYVVSMATTYALMGVLVGGMGITIQGFMQSPIVIISFAFIFVLLGLSMMGVYQLQLPAGIRNKLNTVSQRQQGGSFKSVAIIGVLSALIVGPCMTAPLAGALLFIAETGSYVIGGFALWMLGLGMGAPLLLVGVFGAKLLPKPGAWMTRINAVFGFLMLAVAIYFLGRIVPPGFDTLGYALLGVGFALWFYCQFKMAHRKLAYAIIIAASILAVHAAVALPERMNATAAEAFMAQFEPMNSLHDFESLKQRARTEGRWVFVDLYADWCVICKSFERDVLSRSDIQNALEDFILVKPDVTAHTPEQQALMKTLRVMGPPTLLFISPQGEEVRKYRMAGSPNVERLIYTLEEINNGATF
jgi:thiol:disulfide interchange protein DsbD